MRILVSGASGLVGSALVSHFRTRGHEIVPLRRSQQVLDAAWWDPARGEIDLRAAGRVEAVIHLAGEHVGTRWSASKKRQIRESRVAGTRLLSQAVANLTPLPKVFMAASAIGYYGDRGEEWLDEESGPGVGFLASLCQEWEAASNSAATQGVRVIHLRFGLILSCGGGALGRMLPVFRLGLGGRIGSGRQYWSWITIGDVVGGVEHLLQTKDISGPVNMVGPHPVPNREFARVLGRVLGRPALLPLPAWAARAALGEMADETLLASQRVRPQRLEQAGYVFQAPDLEEGLERLKAEG